MRHSSRTPELPAPFVDVDLPRCWCERRDGKVRVSARPPDTTGVRAFITTDRLSAFDHVIAGIPYKGQVLNQLSAWWFEQTAGIVANHVVSVPDPNVTVAIETVPLPVEVIVRGAITGVTSTSLWRRYAAGHRIIDGHRLPDGLRKNMLLPDPIITPTTKPPAGSGLHDEPLAPSDVVARGLVDAGLWEQVSAAALALFQLGQQVAADAGLILADTKYEFGLDSAGTLRVIDEIHTPDSSRFWVAATHRSRLAAGAEPESLDKEAVRLVLAERGYRGDGPPPVLPTEVVAATTARYIDAYERLTSQAFEHGSYPVAERLRHLFGGTT